MFHEWVQVHDNYLNRIIRVIHYKLLSILVKLIIYFKLKQNLINSGYNMSALTPERIKEILKFDQQQRFQYLCKEVNKQQQVWLLIDEHGCVMLNTEDEDCVPVWPNREFAEAWATEEWSHCKAEAINLDTWYQRWTQGLEEDELAIVVFPDKDLNGLIFFPDEFEHELILQSKKK